MPAADFSPPRVLVFGGDGRYKFDTTPFEDRVKVCPSSKRGGRARFQSGLAAIRGAGLVIILTKWIGHPDRVAIETACRQAGVSFRSVYGGLSSARGIVRAFLTRGK